MKFYKFDTMIRGWFVGAFTPNAFKTDVCEVGVKHYSAGEHEAGHFHKISTEITLVLSGTVVMFNKEWSAGDIIVVEPGDVTDFLAVTDSINVVVKVPGKLDDKYLIA